MARERASIVVVDRNIDGADAVVRDVEKQGGRGIHCYQTYKKRAVKWPIHVYILITLAQLARSMGFKPAAVAFLVNWFVSNHN